MSVMKVAVFINDNPFEMIVDTGATFSVLPEAEANRLEIKPIATRTLVIADGSRIARPMGQARFRFPDRDMEIYSPVIIGTPDAPPLLGTHTLEAFLLAVDTDNRCLVEMPEVYLCPGEVVGYARGALYSARVTHGARIS